MSALSEGPIVQCRPDLWPVESSATDPEREVPSGAAASGLPGTQARKVERGPSSSPNRKGA